MTDPWVFELVDAAIFDMDGVVTDTAAVHAAAWKQLFDSFLEARAQRTGEPFVPFDTVDDYRPHVDGKPRYDGVRDFLASRGISLPEGDPEDPPDRETVCGLGNRKNRAFLDRLERDGARAYESTVALVEQLKSDGMGVAVISASENMSEVLDAAGLSGLFDARVDGRDATRLNLPGKPDPAVFTEAARLLDVDPARTAVVEDAIAGVDAGRRGTFGLVVGVDRTGHPDALRQAGADLVVPDLGELLRPPDPAGDGQRHIRELPDALDAFPSLVEQLAHRAPAVFLDYDGTITPIVGHPDEAVLAPEVREILRDVAARLPVAVVSGRDLADVRRLVGLAGIWYAGSHGFDIAGPDGERFQRATGSSAALEAAADELQRTIDGLPGAWVERKTFALAVHFRQTPEERTAEVANAVEQVARQHPRLRLTGGKRVLELRPNIDWDKGRAVRRLLAIVGRVGAGFAPVYVGDDLTDEDAFRAIRHDGVGVVVRGESDDRETWAAFALAGPDRLPAFLERLAGEDVLR
jgi:trehalose-phosphatase